MHRGLSFISIVAVVGLFLNASVVGFAQDQSQQDDLSVDDNADAPGDDLDESAPSGDSDLSEEQPSMESEDEQETQTSSEVAQESVVSESESDEEQEQQQESDAEQQTGLEKMAAEMKTEAQAQGDLADTTGQLALELGTFFRSDDSADTFALAPILSLWFEITDALDLVLEVGCAYAGRSDEANENPSHFYLGNPFLGIRRAFRSDRTLFHFGFGLTVPISSIEPDDDFEQTTYQIASATRGRWNLWLWMPEHLALVIPIGARMVSEDNILFGGELGLAVIAPTGDYHDHRGDFVAQGAGELGFGFETVETGLRLQAVLIPLITNEDKFQSAVGPFVKLILDGGHLAANVMVNLDADQGVFGEADRWGLNLKGGLDF